MIYFVLRINGSYSFYGNLRKLCEEEDVLGYSAMAKHMQAKDYWRNETTTVWRGVPKKNKRNG